MLINFSLSRQAISTTSQITFRFFLLYRARWGAMKCRWMKSFHWPTTLFLHPHFPWTNLNNNYKNWRAQVIETTMVHGCQNLLYDASILFSTTTKPPRYWVLHSTSSSFHHRSHKRKLSTEEPLCLLACFFIKKVDLKCNHAIVGRFLTTSLLLNY